MIKNNVSFVFKGLRKIAIRSFYMVPYFSIQVNSKLDVEVQSVIRIIIYNVKNVFKKFRWWLKKKVSVFCIHFQFFVTPTTKILVWFKNLYSVFRFNILKFGFEYKE